MELIKQRAMTHGEFSFTSDLAVRLADACSPPIDSEPRYTRHAREMICVKLARIASGDPMYADHWRDIAGYAMLVVGMLERHEDDGA